MSEFISYKNIKVHYTDTGTGDVVVLLHGFLENLGMWHRITPLIAKSHRVIAIDLLGHGNTECTGYIHTMEAMAEAVKAVLKHLNITQYGLIGHSMGGYVSLALAETYPDAVTGLFLMNSTAKADSSEKRINRDRAIAMVKTHHETFIRMSMANLFRPENRALFTDQVEWAKTEALKTPLQGIIAALEGMKIRKDRSQLLQVGTYPKIMLLGQKDPILDYEALVKEIASQEVDLVTVPDGHMSHIEDWKSFSYSILQFIEKL